jgi:hypothetical protein
MSAVMGSPFILNNLNVGGGGKPTRAVCGNCERTVHVLALPDGTEVRVDPELISVVIVATNGGTKIGPRHARRVHAELCDTYARAADKAERLQEMRAFTKRQKKRRRPGL